MNRNVLLVDDQPLVLEALRRRLSTNAVVETATCGQEGLRMIRDSGPFAVVMSDMDMPDMNGTAFLEQVRQISPDSVRMILTGHAELESAISAVNFGHIFRFLRKPCKPEELMAALAAGIEQFELITSRKELLERTLHGTVQVLAEILALTNPLAQKRAGRIARYAEEICANLEMPMPWQLQIALMLSQIGCISLPEDVLAKVHAGQALSEESLSIYRSHPELASRLLSGIPRLEPVAQMIAHQLSGLDVSAQPADLREWGAATFGAMILKLAADLDDIVGAGASLSKGVKALIAASPGLPRSVRDALGALQPGIAEPEQTLVTVAQLRIGMILDEDVISANGLRLVSRGQEITRSIMLRLQSFADGVGVTQPFRVIYGH